MTSISADMTRVTPLLFGFVLVLSICAVYGPTLSSPFLFDDIPNISQNNFLKITELSKDSLLYVCNGAHPNPLRKLPHISFALNYLGCGNQTWCYHVTNIGIHAVTALLVWWFFYQLLGIGWLFRQFGAKKMLLSWLAAMIWALHPIQINAVTYIVQRMTSMSAMFGFLALNFWLKARRCYIPGEKSKPILWTFCSLLAFGAGLFCKENIVVLPILALVTEFLLLRRGQFRIPIIPSILFLISTCLFVWLYLPPERLDFIVSGYERRDFSMVERLLTQTRVLVHYLSLFFFPVGERFSLLYEFPVSRGLFSPFSTFACSLFWIFLGIIVTFFRRKVPIVSWVVGWFLVGHLVESSIIPLEIIFEHRNYLPSASLSLGTVLYGHHGFSNYVSNRRIQWMIVIFALLVLASSVLTRNLDYRDAVVFYRTELKKFPDSRRLRVILAQELNRRGEFQEGGGILRDTVDLYPEDITVLVHWYMFLNRVVGEKQKSEDVYRSIKKSIENGFYDGRHGSTSLKNLADFFMKNGRNQDALFLLDAIIEKHGNLHPLWFNKGVCLSRLQRWEEASIAFRKGLTLDPGNYPLMYWLGKSLIRTGRTPEGCKWVERSKADPATKKGSSLSEKLFENECEG